MRNAVTVLGIIQVWQDPGMSHWKAQCRETRMLRLGRGRRKRAGSSTSPAAYSTLRGLGSSNAPWLPGTLAILGPTRRLSKYYERRDTLSESLVYLASIGSILRRPAPNALLDIPWQHGNAIQRKVMVEGENGVDVSTRLDDVE
jgi:hypothetical protein